MGSVWELDLTAPKLIVLLALADHADHNGNNVYPSVRLIAWKTGYSSRQVQRIMKALIADGILQVVKVTSGSTTKYRIDVDAGSRKKPFNLRQDDLRQDVTPDTIMSPLPMTSDVVPPHDITVSPKPSVKPSSKPKEKEKEITPLVEIVPGLCLPKEMPSSPEERARLYDVAVAQVAERLHNTVPKPYTDAELEAQKAAALAKYGGKAS